MADTSTVIRLKAVDEGAIALVNNASNAFTGLTVGTTALSVAFKGLSKVSDSSFGQMVLGAKNAERLGGAIAKLADINSTALKSFSALSDITFIGGQFLTAAKGIQDAAQAYARIPQTLDLLRASGVSTRSVEDFYNLTDAVKGSEVALEQFAISAVQELGKFEQAAARAGTILRSSVNFDRAGLALRANQKEQADNAFQVQNLVNQQLNNTVSSTEALVGQYEVLSSGFVKAAESQQVLESGLKLIGIGQAGGSATDPGETLRLLTKTLNAYQLSAGEAGKTAAVLNSIVENGLTTIQELSLNFGQTATSANAAGIGLNDLAASTAVLTTQGIGTATALTGLQRVAANVISKVPEAQEALSKLSLNGQKIRFDQAEIQAKGFTQALIDLNKAAGGNAKVLQEIFPEEVAFRTVLALLAQDGQKLSSVLQNTASVSASSLDEVFKIATGDRINKFQQIVNRFQELIIRVAQSVAPVFEPGLAVLEKISNAFSSLPNPVKEAIGQFIVFQVTSRATISAVGILFQTMLSLAGAYLQVRLVSLALSGQLGREVAIVRDLITQRKGLLAVALQLFGVDQRFRLGAQATTEALEKQNIATKAIAATRAKAGEIFNANISGFTGRPIAEAGKQATERGKQVLEDITKSAKNIGLGLAETVGVVATPQILGPDGKPLRSGLGRIKQEAQQARTSITSAISGVNQISIPVPNIEISQIAIQAKEKVAGAYQGIKAGAEQARAAIASEAVVTASATAATSAHIVALTADELAERGLAQTRIFGQRVLFATSGPLGAINTLLATQISLKAVAAGATRSLAIAQGTATNAAKIFGIALGAPIAGIGALGKAASGFALNGVTGLVGALGPLAPLLAVTGVAAFAFREDLFGLRKAANEAAEGLAEVLKKDAELSKQFGSERRLIEFKAELTPSSSTPQVETRLEELRLSGDLTTGQFDQLRETLAKVGAQGKLTADGLDEFRAQLEAIRQGAQGKPEKGIGDRVGEFITGVPGRIAGAGDYLLNIFGAAASNPLEFFNPFTSGKATQKVAQNREADRLIQDFSQIGLTVDAIGTQSLASAEKIKQYQNALGLASQTSTKIKSGAALTATDLEREEQIFKAQKTRNENLISEVEKNVTAQNKLLQSIKDPELKSSAQARIALLESERSSLERRNEALKAGREEFVKYYTETLPNLKRAIAETSNLQLSLSDAQTNFSQQFKLDAQGKATPYLKDITTLRNEAAQYVAQINEAYQGGLFERSVGGADAELEAVRRLREARDNQIRLNDGTSGYRLGVSDRITATQQIVELESTASKNRISALSLEIEKNKLFQIQRVKSTEDAEKAIAQLQIKSIKESLAQKELEIKEYAQFPVRRAQLEKEAAALRVQVQQQESQEIQRLLEKQRGQRQEAINIEIEQTKALQAERFLADDAAQKEIAKLQIKSAKDRLNNLLEDYNKSNQTSIDLAQKVSIARAQLRQQEAAEVERLFLLEQERQKRIIANTAQLQSLFSQRQSFTLEAKGKDLEGRLSLLSSASQLQSIQADAVEAQISSQLKLTGDVEKRAQLETLIAENKVRSLVITQKQEQASLAIQTQANRIQAEREAIQLRVQKIEQSSQVAELNLELVKAKRERRTPEEIQAIQLQIQSANQQLNLLGEQSQRLERSRIQQEQIAENSRKELDIKQRIAASNADIEVKLARQREIQSGIEKIIKNIEFATQTSSLAGQIQINRSEALLKVYDQQKNLLSANQSLTKGRVDFITGELQLASDLSRSERQKREIAQTIAAIKLRSLEGQLNMEQQVLNLNLAQQSAQLEQEKIRNRISQSQNAAEVAKAQVELVKLQAEPTSTPEAIKAAQLNIQAKVEEGISLQFAETLLKQQGEIQKTLGGIELRNLRERSQLQRDQANVEYAQTLPRREQGEIFRELRERSLFRTGISPEAMGAFVKQTSDRLRPSPIGLEPLEQVYAGQVSRRISPKSSLQVQFPDFDRFRNEQLSRLQVNYQMPSPQFTQFTSQDLGQAGLVEAVQRLTDLVNQRLSGPSNVSVETPINNYFTTQDAGRAADTVTQQIRRSLYDLGRELGR